MSLMLTLGEKKKNWKRQLDASYKILQSHLEAITFVILFNSTLFDYKVEAGGAVCNNIATLSSAAARLPSPKGTPPSIKLNKWDANPAAEVATPHTAQ